MRVRKWLWRMGAMFFFFSLVKFTLFKKIQFFLNFFVTNGKISPEKKTLDGRLKN